jgi:hypothetical protein
MASLCRLELFPAGRQRLAGLPDRGAPQCSESEIRTTLEQRTGRISDSMLHWQVIVSSVVIEFEVPTARMPSM